MEMVIATERMSQKEGITFYDAEVNGRTIAVVDFVSQLCRWLKVPRPRGLNMRYIPRDKLYIDMGVDIIGPAQFGFECVLYRRSEKDPWQVDARKASIIELAITFSAVDCDEAGNYEFTAVN